MQQRRRVTGDSDEPDRHSLGGSARSATTSEAEITPEEELSVLVATDVLSEGQNLQDCCDRRQLRLAVGDHPPDPAGRPRRPHRPEGREDPLLLLPSGRRRRAHHSASRPRSPAAPRERRGGRDRRGVLRGRRERPGDARSVHEKAGILDGEADNEVDLASYAFQIWKNAIDRRPELAEDNPRYAARRLRHEAARSRRKGAGGVLVYLRTAEGNDALAWSTRTAAA